MAFQIAGVSVTGNVNSIDLDISGMYVSKGLSIESPPMYGTVAGFVTGGTPSPGPGGYSNEIQRFPFATNANAVDAGDLTVYVYSSAGQSSTTHGYRSAGIENPPGSSTNVIDKFLFSTYTTLSVDVGDLTVARYRSVGQSSTICGYTSGGVNSNVIDKFPFANGGNATDVGDLTGTLSGSFHGSSQSSFQSGYTSGVLVGSYNRGINKFPFASDNNATSIGTLVGAYGGAGAGQSSLTHGYNSGSTPFYGYGAVIEKFPFAVDSSATSVGSLYTEVYHNSGQSSSVSGYSSGGFPTTNVIQKFPFASDAGSSDVGDLIRGMQYVTGQQD